MQKELFARMSNTRQQPLHSYQNASPQFILYDADIMLDIEFDKVKGFLVLLENESLGFPALTDGNIIDACLGVAPMRRKGSQYFLCRDAKIALVSSAETSESIMNLAVLTYREAMLCVIDYHTRLQKTVFCCRCFFQHGMRKKTKAKLRRCFGILEEAVEASAS
jgi:hypothetical protein